MWTRAPFCAGGSQRFFSLSFGDGALAEYYKLNFSLLYYHKFDVNLFDNMIPWEKDVYINMLANKIKEEEEKRKLKDIERRSRTRRR